MKRLASVMSCGSSLYGRPSEDNDSSLVVRIELSDALHYSFEQEPGVNSLMYGCGNDVKTDEEINFYIPHSFFLSDDSHADHVVETVKQPNGMLKTVEKN